MIRIITTGGTIGGLEYENIQKKSEKNYIPITTLLNRVNALDKYIITAPFQKDSRFITGEDRNKIADAIRASKEKKILITHGTYTMCETAKFLGDLNLGYTIVLVGAFILGSNPKTDAHFNLGYALGTLELLEPGVYIAMNGTIFSGNNISKNQTLGRFEQAR